MANVQETEEPSAEDELVISRHFDAPRQLVFAAFTDPQRISAWWGPHGFTTTTHEHAFELGGVWRFTMHSPEGTDYHDRVTFNEIRENELISYRIQGEGEHAGFDFQTTFSFADEGDGTRLTLRMSFGTPAMLRQMIEKFGALEGGRQTLERLAEHLSSITTLTGEPMMNDQTTLKPHLICTDAKAAIAFYERVFGATPGMVLHRPDGMLMHAELCFGTSSFYLAETCPEYGAHDPKSLGGSPVTLHLQVPDCDAVFGRAVEAGCTVRMPMADMFWGDRYGMVVDPWGHVWSVATAKRTLTAEQIESAFAEETAGTA